MNQIAAAHENLLIEKGSHILITADLNDNDDFNLIKEEENKQQTSTYSDIRLKKLVKTNDAQVVYQEINLKMNALGKYVLDKK